MNNYDLIRRKTLKELAEFIEGYVYNCDSCPCKEHDYIECSGHAVSCAETIEIWLKEV